ncbi:MAG TPA: hypothetical protein VK148_14475 [Xanthobacteraceae bacterium]|nr:hypothetical protein [Xanthobacteraceae bacterium]
MRVTEQEFGFVLAKVGEFVLNEATRPSSMAERDVLIVPLSFVPIDAII